MEEELDDVRPAVDQVAFEVVDPAVTLRPDAFGYEVVHTRHQHVLVMRAIEDDHFPPRRCVQVRAPEEIVRRLLLGRDLESVDARALRVHRAEDVSDGAVLAPRVHPLQDDEQRAPVLGVEEILQLPQPARVLRVLRLGRFLALVLVLERRVDRGEFDLASGRDPEPLAVEHRRSSSAHQARCQTEVFSLAPLQAATA